MVRGERDQRLLDSARAARAFLGGVLGCRLRTGYAGWVVGEKGKLRG